MKENVSVYTYYTHQIISTRLRDDALRFFSKTRQHSQPYINSDTDRYLYCIVLYYIIFNLNFENACRANTNVVVRMLLTESNLYPRDAF